MNFLTLTESKLPPGFRFHPRDDELVCDYLAKKISSDDSGVVVPAMVEVDLNKCEPWELPETARVGGKEWYFFSQRDRKYATGLRTNRATASGYWKATGKDRQVYHAQTGELVGMRKTLVFYQGRAPKGRKSDWVMHEFRVEGSSPPSPPPSIPFKEDWVLCRVFHKTRGSSDKSSTENSYYEETTSSSPLPALVEDPCLQIEGYEHGPCFSRFNQGHTSCFEGVTDMNLNLYSMPKLEDCLANDEDVLKAVLDHLTQPDEHVKLEVPIATIGECSSFSRFKYQSLNHESYLPDIDIMQNMWKSYE